MNSIKPNLMRYLIYCSFLCFFISCSSDDSPEEIDTPIEIIPFLACDTGDSFIEFDSPQAQLTIDSCWISLPSEDITIIGDKKAYLSWTNSIADHDIIIPYQGDLTTGTYDNIIVLGFTIAGSDTLTYSCNPEFNMDCNDFTVTIEQVESLFMCGTFEGELNVSQNLDQEFHTVSGEFTALIN